jgi:outer membrane protein OmpA-like peptidoglycan-associated protein
MMRLIQYVLAALWLSMGSVHAQTDAKPTDEKALRKLRQTIKDADNAFIARRLTDAVKLYTEAFNADVSNYHVAYRLARSYRYLGRLENAIDNYRQAISINPNANDTIYFDLAEALKKSGNYAEARQQFDEFLKRYKYNDEFKQQAQFQRDGCDRAIKLMAATPMYRIDTTSINDKDNDYNPRPFYLKADTFIIFTTHRAGNKGKGNYQFTDEKFSDLWISKLTYDTVLGPPENLGKKVNTKANDGSAVVDPSGTILYYTICGGGKYRKYWGCSIYSSEYNSDTKQWGKFKKVGASDTKKDEGKSLNGMTKRATKSNGKTKKVPTFDSQPFFSPDGQTIYFVSDREGGLGGTDIWYCQKSGDAWGPAVHAGDKINTPFDELYPSIGPDGKLYFASNGHKNGLGGFDLYVSEGELGNWGEPQNLGYPLNTSYDDFTIHWFLPESDENAFGFITSDRPNAMPHDRKSSLGFGRDDIWRFRKAYRPPIKITVHGTVRNYGNKQVIPFATVTLYKILDNKLIPVDTFKTAQDGRYEFPLESGFDYKIVGNAYEYLANEVFVSTKDVTESADLERDIDIYLERIKIEPYVLQNIYYDFDKWDLRPESEAELNRLVKIMNDNPGLVIQVGSHTDTNGSEEYNRPLADKRARSVVDYLVKAGIDRGRLSSFGYGESQPLIYPEMSEADEQANRRTEFRILSLDYDKKKKPQ